MSTSRRIACFHPQVYRGDGETVRLVTAGSLSYGEVQGTDLTGNSPYMIVSTLSADEAAGTIDVNLRKDLFCTFLASKKIEAALAECMKRVTYNGLKITEDTFEPVEARDDYLTVCVEVTRENVVPFMKSLFAYGPDL